MHRSPHLAVGKAVIYLSALAPRNDQPAFAQKAEMMCRRGRGDAEPLGKMRAAFLAVAKYPEYFYPSTVAEHLEELGCRVEICDIIVTVRVHFILLFGNNIRLFGHFKPKRVDFSLCKQYNTFRTIKQVFNCKKFKGAYIMKKIYKIEVDCAHCAAKAEDAAKKVEGVCDLAINFMTQKMTIVFAEGADEKKVLAEILKTCRKVERHFAIEA
jgi:copper chaperone CopZ